VTPPAAAPGAPAPLDLVAFGAHPDDVELFCGGLLATLAAAGYRVGVVDLTRGERASAGTPEERDAEARAAAAVLGLAWRECLDLPDTGIDPADGVAPDARRPASQLGRAVACLRRLRPELVVVPHTAARHPDHAAAGLLLRRAVFYANVRGFDAGTPDPPHRPRQVLAWPERVEVEPTLVVDVSAMAARKVEAIRCHRSQVERPAGAADGTLVSSPQMLGFLDARDRLAGARIGVTHGEPYLLVDATVGLADPIDHFRRNPFPHPHLLPRR
jgi:bacillithiol biosynthesis deacetylase BshB1